MGVVIQFERRDLALDLWAHGEDDLYPRVSSLSDAEVARIGERAAVVLLEGPRTTNGSTMQIWKALCLAAVEVMTGEERPLTRNRRRPDAEYPG